MPSSSSHTDRLRNALGTHHAEVLTILNAAAKQATIAQGTRHAIISAFGKSAGEEVIQRLTLGTGTASQELKLEAASAMGLQHAEFLTLLAAVV